MRRAMLLLAGAGGVCVAVWKLETSGAMLPGLIAGLGLGTFMLLLSSAAGRSLGYMLQPTRLEDQVLSMGISETMHSSPSDWLGVMEQVGPWPGGRPVGDQQFSVEHPRQFIWEDDLPPIENLAEVER